MDLYREITVFCLFRSVEFETRDDMADCIRKADNTELGGKKIRLTEVSTVHVSVLPVFAFSNNRLHNILGIVFWDFPNYFMCTVRLNYLFFPSSLYFLYLTFPELNLSEDKQSNDCLSA